MLLEMYNQKNTQTIDSIKLADYILQRGGPMSHLKLQKLLFYVQAHHLACFDKPIIEDDFQAWAHGPVSRKLYDSLKDKSILYTPIHFDSKNGSKDPKKLIKETLTKDQIDLLNEILTLYGTLSHDDLETLTHSENPWIDARTGYGDGQKCDVVIEKNHMRVFYKKNLTNG